MQDNKALVERVVETIRREKLFLPGVTVVGVSGGVDSLALLHILVHLRDRLKLDLHVATLDHGLRGEAGRADAEFVRQTAEAWGVPVTVGAADVRGVQRETHMGVEEAARYVRYRFFGEVVKATNAAQLAIAHQRDDQVETVLMHLLRGAGSAGLGGMRYIAERDGLRIIRPLLDIERAKLESYIQEQGLQPREDETNADLNYTRNKIRRELLPFLRIGNPYLDYEILRTAAIMRADDDALNWTLVQMLPAWPERADLDAYKRLPVGLQRLAVRKLDYTLSYDRTVDLAESLAESLPGQRIRIDPYHYVAIDRSGMMTLITSQQRYEYVAPFDPSEMTFPLWKSQSPVPIDTAAPFNLLDNWQLSIMPYTDPVEPDWDDPLSGVLYIPHGAAIALRTRQSGDRFAPLGLGGHRQKLSDTLINLKVPSRWRDKIPFLTIDGDIAWFVAPTPDGLRSQVADPFAWRADRSPLWAVRYQRG